MTRCVSFEVIGTPAPQGSKRHVGRGVMVEMSKKLAPWREAVVWQARQAMRCDCHQTMSCAQITPQAGPVAVGIVFTLPRPKSAPKARRWPHVRPDLDKLTRSTLDALKTAGVYGDDGQVCALDVSKRYVGDKWALDVPGAVIEVREMEA